MLSFDTTGTMKASHLLVRKNMDVTAIICTSLTVLILVLKYFAVGDPFIKVEGL